MVMNQKNMTFIEHMEEFRKRLFITVIFFVLALIGSLFIAQPIIRVLQHSKDAKSLTLNAFRLTDPFKIYMEMAFLVALIIIIPVILYQLWAFVSPGLLEKERKATLAYIPAAIFLFLAGLAFSYFILFPLVLKFMLKLSHQMGIHAVIGINEYFQFLFHITLPFGFLFQMPVVMLFLTRLGMVTPMFLSKIRKYAYFALIVIAAFITPPDILSHMMVSVPLLLLYEVSLFISRIGYKKALAAEARYALEQTEM